MSLLYCFLSLIGAGILYAVSQSVFTTVAFCESQDNAAAYAEVAAVADQHLTVSGDYVYVPQLNNLLSVFALMGATVPGSVYISSPSLRAICNLYVSPVFAGIACTDTDLFELQPRLPIKLKEGEGIKVMSNANPSAAEYHSAIILLGDGAPQSVNGEIFTIQATAAITGVNGAWANGAITFAETLPVGTYDIVGAVCLGANLVAFRFVPIGYSWRPGFTCNAAIDDRYPSGQRYGRMGKWCSFHTSTPPTIDILGVDTCTSQVLYIDLIKTS